MNCASSEPLLSSLISSSTTRPPLLCFWLISFHVGPQPPQGGSDLLFPLPGTQELPRSIPSLFRSLLRRHFIEESFPVDAAWAFVPLSLSLPPSHPPPTSLFVLFGTHNNMTYYAYLFVYCVPSTLECKHHSMTAGTLVTFVLCCVPRESGIC